MLTAAALRRYPYGMSVRVAQFLVPSTLLFAAAGLGGFVCRARRFPLGHWAIPALTVVLAAMGLGRLAHDLVTPYRTPWDRSARDFARWFWDELSVDAELVCVRTDLGISFRPEAWAYDAADQYLCLQRIYSRRHQQRRPPNWDKISAERPLRCVLLNRMPAEVPAFLDWIETQRDRYRLRDVRTYPASRGSRAEPRRPTWYVSLPRLRVSQPRAIAESTGRRTWIAQLSADPTPSANRSSSQKPTPRVFGYNRIYKRATLCPRGQRGRCNS